jgi:hypothetical protein
MFIGKKGFEAYKNSSFTLNVENRELFAKLNAENVFNIGETVINDFVSGKYDEVRVLYNQFKNAATQIIKEERMLPVEFDHFESKKSKKVTNDYIFEPSKTEILQDLIPRAVKTQLFKAVLDSSASEHGARMVAMDKATENAGELLKALKLLFEIRAIVPSLLFPKFSSLSAAQSVYGLSASPFQPVTLAILPLFCLITNPLKDELNNSFPMIALFLHNILLLSCK